MGLSEVSAAISQFIGERTFNSLHLPFAVTAVDIETAELLALREGSVREAILATIAVPGVFPPQTWGGRTVVDGGVLDPVPVRLGRTLAPHLPVIAVVLSPSIRDWIRRPNPRLLSTLPFVGKYIARLRWAQALNIFLRSVDMSGALMTDLHLEISQPDAVIRPDIHHIGLIDKVNISEIAMIGELAVPEVIADIREASRPFSAVRRRVHNLVSPSQGSIYVS
jgi:NTE family protein